jgi:hypothetical protein
MKRKTFSEALEDYISAGECATFTNVKICLPRKSKKPKINISELKNDLSRLR